MAWQDDDLAAYERGRAAKVQSNELSTQRNKLLEGRHNKEWMALREDVLKQFDWFNKRSGRLIAESRDPHANALKIHREDGEELTAAYDAIAKTVTFSCQALPFVDKSYELTVRSIDGNDAVVWCTVGKRPETISRDAIVKEVVSGFLHAGSIS